MQPSKPTKTAYNELQAAYDYFNEHLFDSELPEVLITFQRNKRTLGYFSPERFSGKTQASELAMNPAYFGARSLIDTLSTLVHEMCHVWQHYAPVKKCRGGYHDKIWADKMESVGLTPSSTAAEGGSKTGQKVSHYITRGGRFQQAAFDLISSGYEISWYDEYGSQNLMPSSSSIEVMDDWIAKAGEDNELIEKIVTTIAKDNPLPKMNDPVRASTLGMKRLIEAEKPTPNKSNRCKYSCSGCGLNAWAKPSASLICGACKVELLEQF